MDVNSKFNIKRNATRRFRLQSFGGLEPLQLATASQDETKSEYGILYTVVVVIVQTSMSTTT